MFKYLDLSFGRYTTVMLMAESRNLFWGVSEVCSPPIEYGKEPTSPHAIQKEEATDDVVSGVHGGVELTLSLWQVEQALDVGVGQEFATRIKGGNFDFCYEFPIPGLLAVSLPLNG